MRSVFSMMLVLVALGVFVCLAQEPPLPEAEAKTSPPPSPQPGLAPPDILTPAERAASSPPPLPTVPSLPQLDEAFKDKPISITAGTAQNHAEWRKLKNEVVNRTNVRAARRAADAARTDLEKRKLLRNYYEIYYGEMIAVATKPELKGYLNDRKNDELNALQQSRVRPTPTPSPTPKH